MPLDEDELYGLVNVDRNIADGLDGLEQQNTAIFKASDLKKFLQTTLAEIDPRHSISGNANDYFAKIFYSFIIPKVTFDYWDILNDQENYSELDGWTRALKMDAFIDKVFKDTVQNDLISKFVYSSNEC